MNWLYGLQGLKNILRLIGAVFIALIAVFFTVESDPWFKSHIEQKLVSFLSTTLTCTFTAHLKSISVLGGYLELEHVVIDQKDLPHTGAEHWLCSCSSMNMTFSWLSIIQAYLTHSNIQVRLLFNSLTIESTINNEAKVACIEYVRKLWETSPTELPISITSCAVRSGSVNLIVPDRDLSVQVTFNSDTALVGNQLKTSCACIDGSVTSHKKLVCANINGFAHIHHLFTGTRIHYSVSSTLRARLPGLAHGLAHGLVHGLAPDDTVLLHAMCEDDRASIELSSQNATCSIKSTLSPSGLLTVAASLPLRDITSLALPEDTLKLDGTISTTFQAQVGNFWETLQAQVALSGACYNGWSMPPLSATLSSTSTECQGQFHVGPDTAPSLQSTWHYNKHTCTGSLRMTESSAWSLPFSWQAYAQEFKLAIGHTMGTSTCSGTYGGKLYHPKLAEQLAIKGSIATTCDSLTITGNLDDALYTCKVSWLPSWHIERANYSRNDIELMSLNGDAAGHFTAMTRYELIRVLLLQLGMADMPGDGSLSIAGKLNDSNRLQATIHMQDAHIRLPYTYNLVEGIHAYADVDLLKRSITLREAEAKLSKGSVRSSQITLDFDQDGQLLFMHAPVMLQDYFMGWQRALFVLVSGACTVSYTPGQGLLCNGQILLDKGHVRSNLFSPEFKSDIVNLAISPLSTSQMPVTLHISLLTRAPLHVKTPFLEATARLNVLIEGSVLQPEIGGCVELLHGSLNFPYQPLYITKGKLYWLPRQLDDPVLELSARNTIKRYSIDMSLTGSLKDHTINFSSSPYLDKEQIITLLLGGSEDGSLYLVMPGTIMQSIEDLLCGPAESSSQLQRSLKNLFKPLKNIRIVPSLSDAQGYGGMRGALAVEVNDRLRGIVQKNFNAAEETLFALEYDISDDTTIRALKDGQGDFGGEIETRWKF